MSSSSPQVNIKAIRAGAGAGKTYNLTHEVVGFAKQFRAAHGRWPSLIVTTFTRKATQELNERLVKLVLEKEPEMLEFVSSSRFLKVSTIHGVLDRFLKSHGHLISLKSDFTYLKQAEAQFYSKKVLKEICEEQPSFTALLSLFSFSQIHKLLLEAVEHDFLGFDPLNESHLLELLESELQSLAQRIDRLLADHQGLVLNERWQEVFADLRAIRTGLTLATWQSQFQQTLEVIAAQKLVGLKTKKIPETIVVYEDYQGLLEDLRHLKKSRFHADLPKALHESNRQFQLLLEQFRGRYFSLKKSLSKIEMGDLELLALEVIRSYPEACSHFAEDKDYWLIDEFQDTSPRQLEILEALIRHKPYYLVGDPQQSIYLFRGARSEVFHEKFEAVRSRQGDLRFLETNYRSTPELLDFINSISTGLGPQFAAMTADPSKTLTPRTCVRLQIVEPHPDEEDGRDQELSWLQSQIAALKREGVALEKIAVLVRKNRDLEDVGRLLSLHGIPVILHSSGLFWRRREVRDALTLFKFLNQPHDDLNLAILLRSPLFAIAENNLAERLHKRSASIWSTIREACRAGDLGHSAQKLFHLVKDRAELGLVLAFEKALHSLGYFDFHLHYDSTGRSEGNLWKFLHLLKTFERSPGAQMMRFVRDAEKAFYLEASVDSPGSIESNKINVMTVHASKGLEFDHVFLPFLGQKPYFENHLNLSVDEEDKLWSIRAPISESDAKSSGSLFERKVLDHFHQRQKEEDQRLFYVALSRAKLNLYLSWQTPSDEGSWSHYFNGLDLTPGTHGGESYHYEVTQGSVPVASATATPLQSATASVRPPFLAPSESRAPAAAAQSVTEIVAQEFKTKTYRQAYLKKHQGILFHRLMEIIKYPTTKNLGAIIDQRFPGRQEETLAALNFVLQMESPPVVEIMKAGHVEWSFRTRHGGVEIDGQIDLWGIVDGTLWIVDYKSGGQVREEQAFDQLLLYADALKTYLNWTQEIHLAVIYPFLEKVKTRVV